MDNSFHQEESEIHPPNGFLAGLHIFDGVLNWLAGLVRLTEQEKKDAGIRYPDDSPDR